MINVKYEMNDKVNGAYYSGWERVKRTNVKYSEQEERWYRNRYAIPKQ